MCVCVCARVRRRRFKPHLIADLSDYIDGGMQSADTLITLQQNAGICIDNTHIPDSTCTHHYCSRAVAGGPEGPATAGPIFGQKKKKKKKKKRGGSSPM